MVNAGDTSLWLQLGENADYRAKPIEYEIVGKYWIVKSHRLQREGHAKIYRNGKNMLAHQYSYELHKGNRQGKMVLHKCGNAACINPEHLYLGDHKQNMKDMATHGSVKGEKNGGAKLTITQVEEIRTSKEKTTILAKMYNVHRCTIHRIKEGRTWQT